MKLITKEISKKIPSLYSNENKGAEEIKVPLKLFNPTGVGTWYITEMDINTGLMFGWCDLGEPELGYVDFNELKSFRGRFGLGIERDMWWDSSTTLSQVMTGKVI